jgi:hypothetical protein
MGVGCGSFLPKLGCKEFVVGPPLPFSDSYFIYRYVQGIVCT